MALEKTPRGAKKKALDPLLAPLLMATTPRKGELMKERIVLSALQCIANKGIEETSFEAIGKPLGIGRSHVAYHFKDKGDIIRTAIDYVIARGQSLTTEQVEKAEGARAKLHAVIDAFFDWADAAPEGMAVYVLFLYYATIHGDYRDHNTAMRRVSSERMVKIMQDDSRFVAHHSEDELEDIAKTIQYLGYGALIDMVTTGGINPKAVARARKRVLAALDLLIK
jgi:AcrR family transcriptional regulator